MSLRFLRICEAGDRSHVPRDRDTGSVVGAPRSGANLMLRVCCPTLHQTADLDGTSWIQWNGNRAELMLISGFPAEAVSRPWRVQFPAPPHQTTVSEPTP
jgi:hypothetical protein